MLLFVFVTVHIITVHRSHTLLNVPRECALVNVPRECAWRLFGHRFKANCAAEMRSSKSRFLINRLYFLPRNEYDVIRFVVTRQFLMQMERRHVTSKKEKKEAEEEEKGERERERERDTHTHLLRNITKNETPRMDCNQGTVPAVANSEFLMPADCR
jgi:hypothetical protein